MRESLIFVFHGYVRQINLLRQRTYWLYLSTLFILGN